MAKDTKWCDWKIAGTQFGIGGVKGREKIALYQKIGAKLIVLAWFIDEDTAVYTMELFKRAFPDGAFVIQA
jgi:hypothetical protein